jgi:hypothetical protein
LSDGRLFASVLSAICMSLSNFAMVCCSGQWSSCHSRVAFKIPFSNKWYRCIHWTDSIIRDDNGSYSCSNLSSVLTNWRFWLANQFKIVEMST